MSTWAARSLRPYSSLKRNLRTVPVALLLPQCIGAPLSSSFVLVETGPLLNETTTLILFTSGKAAKFAPRPIPLPTPIVAPPALEQLQEPVEPGYQE